MHPSTLSRVLAGDFVPELQNLGKLIAVLPEESDREYCLREYLLDHTPEEYREKIAVSFGALREEKGRPVDKLTRALQILERRATEDADMRILVFDLAKLFGDLNPRAPMARPDAVSASLTDVLQQELKRKDRTTSSRGRRKSPPILQSQKQAG
jgi:hypothetical protein